MNRIVAVSFLMTFIPFVYSKPQTTPSKSTQESLFLDVWIGDWNLEGTTRYLPTAPEHKLTWNMHGHRILGGSFVQLDQIFYDINGQPEQAMEILRFNPASNTHSSNGYSNDGTTWVATATYSGLTIVQIGTLTTPDGKIIKVRDTWIFSADHLNVSASEESALDGVRWTSWTAKGRKVKNQPQAE